MYLIVSCFYRFFVRIIFAVNLSVMPAASVAVLSASVSVVVSGKPGCSFPRSSSDIVRLALYVCIALRPCRPFGAVALLRLWCRSRTAALLHVPSCCQALILGYLRVHPSQRRRITPKKASPNMPPLIFDTPSRLLTNITGTSLILKPILYAVNFISIWKP